MSIRFQNKYLWCFSRTCLLRTPDGEPCSLVYILKLPTIDFSISEESSKKLIRFTQSTFQHRIHSTRAIHNIRVCCARCGPRVWVITLHGTLTPSVKPHHGYGNPLLLREVSDWPYYSRDAIHVIPKSITAISCPLIWSKRSLSISLLQNSSWRKPATPNTWQICKWRTVHGREGGVRRTLGDNDKSRPISPLGSDYYHATISYHIFRFSTP